MEQLYAVGVTCIQIVQEWFQDYSWLFEVINNISNPHHITEMMFPVVSILDSVFAAQLMLGMAFGGWLNSVMKWWLLEDRPYWWVRESTYYSDSDRPHLIQTEQSCETGPGSPSGHSAAIALSVALIVTWAKHFATDRKLRIPSWINSLSYMAVAVIISLVIVSRMYVAAHFPHQCVLGALIGLYLGPALCIYVTDPYIWRYGNTHGNGASYTVAQRWHVASALVTILVAVITYFGLKACGHDPQSTIKLAFRWCERPDSIKVTTTPLFSLVQCTAYLLGWALAVTPVVAEYRHDSQNRSIIISAFATALSVYVYNNIDSNICKNNTLCYYVSHFFMYASKPMVMLRLIPFLAKWPYRQIKVKSD